MRYTYLIGLASVALSLSLVAGCARNDLDPAEAPIGTDAGRSEDRFAPRDEGGRRKSGRSGDAEKRTEAGSAPPTASEESAMGSSWDGEADAIARERSPGLGTEFGETRSSSVDTVSFSRADPSRPDVVFSIHYDDVTGVREVARNQRSRAFSDSARMRESDLTFALLDGDGHVLPAASVGSSLWAVGDPESRYTLAVANDSSVTYEVVLSVDGLDVIDGHPAALDKRGYVIDPFSSVVIDGWRTSEDTVAAFRFASIEDSYAELTGEGRNIGVIGAAFFREAPRHWEEWRAPEDTWRRETADPFPGSR